MFFAFRLRTANLTGIPQKMNDVMRARSCTGAQADMIALAAGKVPPWLRPTINLTTMRAVAPPACIVNGVSNVSPADINNPLSITDLAPNLSDTMPPGTCISTKPTKNADRIQPCVSWDQSKCSLLSWNYGYVWDAYQGWMCQIWAYSYTTCTSIQVSFWDSICRSAWQLRSSTSTMPSASFLPIICESAMENEPVTKMWLTTARNDRTATT